MLEQRSRRDVDANLVIADAHQHDLPHVRQAVQVVTDLAYGQLERGLVRLAEEHNHDHRQPGLEFRDDNALRLLGQVDERVDRALHLVGRLGGVDPVTELDQNPAAPLDDRRRHLLDLVEVRQLVLDLPGKVLLDLAGRGPGIGQRDRGRLRGGLREELLGQRHPGGDAPHEKDRHENVDWNRPSHPETREAQRRASPSGDIAVAESRPAITGCTTSPSGRVRDALITIRSPGRSGSRSTTH